MKCTAVMMFDDVLFGEFNYLAIGQSSTTDNWSHDGHDQITTLQPPIQLHSNILEHLNVRHYNDCSAARYTGVNTISRSVNCDGTV